MRQSLYPIILIGWSFLVTWWHGLICWLKKLSVGPSFAAVWCPWKDIKELIFVLLHFHVISPFDQEDDGHQNLQMAGVHPFDIYKYCIHIWSIEFSIDHERYPRLWGSHFNQVGYYRFARHGGQLTTYGTVQSEGRCPFRLEWESEVSTFDQSTKIQCPFIQGLLCNDRWLVKKQDDSSLCTCHCKWQLQP